MLSYLIGTEVLRLGVWKRPGVPKLLSLSLSESGVDADMDDRDGRDIDIDFDERSRTCLFMECWKYGTQQRKNKKFALVHIHSMFSTFPTT